MLKRMLLYTQRSSVLSATDLCIVRSLPQEPRSSSSDAELQLRGKRQADDSQYDQSKRPCVDELSMVPWLGPAGKKRSLGVDDGEQQKKQCAGERTNSVCHCRLHCRMMTTRSCEVNLWIMTGASAEGVKSQFANRFITCGLCCDAPWAGGV